MSKVGELQPFLLLATKEKGIHKLEYSVTGNTDTLNLRHHGIRSKNYAKHGRGIPIRRSMISCAGKKVPRNENT